MRIVISPAKTMVEDTDSFAVTALPRFLPRTRRLLEALRALPAGADLGGGTGVAAGYRPPGPHWAGYLHRV